jgi:hypothetical protein
LIRNHELKICPLQAVATWCQPIGRSKALSAAALRPWFLPLAPGGFRPRHAVSLSADRPQQRLFGRDELGTVIRRAG